MKKTKTTQELIESTLNELLEKLGIQCESVVSKDETFPEENMYRVEMNTDRQVDLIGYHGKNLDAFQVILSIMVNKGLDEEERVRLVVDVDGYRMRREEYARSIAKRASIEVQESGQAMSLPPMKAFERRIVHMTLKDEGFETESLGEEPERYIIVKPKNSNEES